VIKERPREDNELEESSEKRPRSVNTNVGALESSRGREFQRERELHVCTREAVHVHPSSNVCFGMGVLSLVGVQR
jgi:hypothetical protein